MTKQTTKLVHSGRGPVQAEGPVNLPVHRASTILSTDLEAYVNRFADGRKFESVVYGALGTQNARALAEAVATMEGAAGTVVTGSGLSAVTMTLSALLGGGDHVLVSDSAYGPTRTFCNTTLKRYGVRTTYFDPGVGAGIAALIERDTKLVLLEAPGSLTFEMMDIPAITKVTREKRVLTAMDNTWATPLYFKPLQCGVDVSIQAGTKYIAGHSDLVIGLISCRDEKLHRQIAEHTMSFGDVASPDDCYLALRGLRTLAVRLERQSRSAMEVAEWLSRQPEVLRVLFPALPDDPGYDLWKRDFSGASSLFGVALRTSDYEAVQRMVNGLELFNIGSSWGGFESLVAFNPMPLPREVIPWTETPFLLRFHIGLEDPGDLMDDLAASLARI